MTFTLLITLIIGQPSFVDHSSDTLYLDKHYQITEKSNCELIRVIKSTNKNKTFNVTDFFKNGNTFFEGVVEFLNTDYPIGYHKFYYPNGQLKIEGEISRIKKFKGFKEKIWYANGQFMCELKSEGDNLLFMTASDSMGHITARNGNGFVQHEIFFSAQHWKGQVKNYKKDSVWLCTSVITGQLQYEEYYRNGKMLGGKNFLKGGVIEYKEIYSVNEIEKIISIQKQFKKFISRKLKKHKNSMPSFELVISEGKIIQIRQLIKRIDEPIIDISEFEIPSDFILLERGLPVAITKVSLKV